MEKKPAYERIVRHLEHLRRQEYLTESQKRWPDFLFHFTDIVNACRVLTDHALFSRHEMETSGKLATDSASPEIIQATPDEWKEYVRLYFRPRTPTQYRNEGIRPRGHLELGGAHCPTPVFFLFKAETVLSLADSLFSNGNLRANRVEVGASADFFTALPFAKIYHDASLHEMNEKEKTTIIFHRQAEVIIPRMLSLDHLCFIYCRSQAEFETLMCLLSPEVRRRWEKKIGVDSKRMFFFSNWTFVERVFMDSRRIHFTFHSSIIEQNHPAFHARLEITNLPENKKYSWESRNFVPPTQRPMEFSIPEWQSYHIAFSLDDHLVYMGDYAADASLVF